MRTWSIETARKTLGIPLAAAVLAIVLLMGPFPGLSSDGQKAVALFAAVFILYTTEAVPLAVTSVGIVPAIVILHLGKVGEALSGFAAPSVYLMLGAFILASAMVTTGLGQRVSYIILKKIGCTAFNVTLGITVANVLLAFFVPSTTARTLVLLPTCLSIIRLFSEEKRSKFAINLLLTLSFTNATISAGIFTASPPNLITADFMAKADAATSYLEWLIYGLPPAAVMTFLTWGYIQWYYKPEKQTIEGGDAFIAKGLAEMGKVTPAEWRVLAVFLLIVTLWAIGDRIGIDTSTACLIGVVLLMAPKFGVIHWAEASREVNWGVLMVCGGGLSMGSVLIKTGAAKWISTTVFGALGLSSVSPMILLLILMVVAQFMHLLFAATTSMAAALLPIVLALVQSNGMDMRQTMLAMGMIIGGYPLLMFYNTLPSIVVYGTGKLEVGDFPRVGIVLCAIACVVYEICAMTYWQWL